MDFSFALKQLKKGKKMAREGWNEKEQYISLATNVSFLDLSTNTLVNADHSTLGNNTIVFHSISGIQVGWLATQSDMLSEDWKLVN